MNFACRVLLSLSLLFSIAACAPATSVNWEAVSYESSDSLFSEPYIDQDEWRNEPVRHRYIHGGFKGTETRFSFYFPVEKHYEGRFFHYITPVPDSETLSQGAQGEDDKIGFSLSHGAYFIETNGGGRSATAMPGMGSDPTIGAYRANAAAASFSRQVAAKLYGEHRPFGYAFGGSGGAFRTIGGMENTQGAWDGAVPFVMGSPMAIPNVFTVRMYALRVLRDKLPQIADAVDVGGGDPYEGLDAEQSAALREVTRMGFPLKAWPVYPSLGLHGFAVLYPGVLAADPGYFSDFWTKPGYEGYTPTASLLEARVNHPTSIKKLLSADAVKTLLERHQPGAAKNLADTAWQSLQDSEAVAIQLASVPEKQSLGLDMQISSGAAKSEFVPAVRLDGDIVVLGFGRAELMKKLAVGDSLTLTNANFLAAQTYHRHQVPGPEYSVWDQFRDDDGEPVYPQRPQLLGPLFTMMAAGTVPSGTFQGKMILVENLFDTEAYPWQADWYRQKVEQHFGNKAEQHFRLWYIDRANHSDSSRQTYPTQTVSYLGVLQQALLDLSAWVERGVEPPTSTAYAIVDGQVEVPDTAEARGGIQPVIGLLANGAKRADIAPGEMVNLTAEVTVPEGTGKIVEAAWDLDGSGNFSEQLDLSQIGSAKVVLERQQRFTESGTYFVTLRVASQRQGDETTPFTRIQNLARVRVVVR